MLETSLRMSRRSGDNPPQVMRRSGRVDGRLRAARRVKALTAAFLTQLDATDPVTLAAVKKAAELVAVAEDLRRRALQGDVIDLGEMVKVEGVADRAVRALAIDRKRALAPRAPSLKEYLAARRTHGPTPATSTPPKGVP
jgi:hypothetical protein